MGVHLAGPSAKMPTLPKQTSDCCKRRSGMASLCQHYLPKKERCGDRRACWLLDVWSVHPHSRSLTDTGTASFGQSTARRTVAITSHSMMLQLHRVWSPAPLDLSSEPQLSSKPSASDISSPTH